MFFQTALIIKNKKNMLLNRLRHSIGAVGECISRFIHPYKHVRDTHPNRPKGHKVLGLLLVGQEMNMIRHGMEPVEVSTFWHEDMPKKVLYYAKRYVHVTVEWPP